MAKISIPILVDWEEIKNYLAQNDIVEVVRCKDCKWSNWYDADDGHRYCYCMETGASGRIADDFCSYAERRTENVDVNT